MKRFLFPLALALLCTTVFAQDVPDLATKDIVAQIGPLRVARKLQLRADQVAQIKPVLEQVKAARQTQKTAQDEIFARAGESIQRVDQALQAGRKAPQADVTAADRAARESKAAVAATDKAVDDAAQQIYGMLDKNQAKLVETQQQKRARDREAGRSGGTGLAQSITTYVVAMRKLLPEEYDSLRVAMGLRLAGLLVSPDSQGFNTAVGDTLRVMDTVRGMSDADFAQREEQLPQAVGQALRLTTAAPVALAAISYDQFVAFVAGEQTLEALVAYVPAPPLEGQK